MLKTYNQFKLFLTEAPDLLKTKEKLGDKIVSRIAQDHSAKGLLFEDIFQNALDIDPDPRKKFTLWILQRYASGGIRFLEDFGRVNRALKVFIDARNHHNLEGRDQNINNFKGLNDLEALVNKLTNNNMHLSNEDKLLKDLQASGDIDIKYQGSEGYVLILKSHKASCALYSKLAWCTADNDNSEYFDEYHEQGPLIVLSDNKLKKKFQFQKESNQYLDEHDNQIPVEVLTKINDKLINISAKLLGFEDLNIFKITINAEYFKTIKNPSKKLQLTVVKENGYTIQYIKNPSEKIQLAAVTQNGYAIQAIKNPSEKIQLAAVKENGYTIQYIKNPSEKIQLAAVKEYKYAIKHIKNPSERVQLAAIKKDVDPIKYIRNPSERVQLTAVTKNGYAIKYIRNPSERIQLVAVTKNGYAIKYIKNPSETVQLAAVKENINALKYIKTPIQRVKDFVNKNNK